MYDAFDDAARRDVLLVTTGHDTGWVWLGRGTHPVRSQRRYI